MTCPIEEEGLELSVGRVVDADAGVPLGRSSTRWCQAAAAVADRVAFELDRHSAAVSDLGSLFLLERVMALGRQQQEPVPEADVLHVRQATAFAGRPARGRWSRSGICR